MSFLLQIYCVKLQFMEIFIHLMGEVEFWLMQTLLDSEREGTHTLMTMKPGLLAREVNTVEVPNPVKHHYDH